MDIKIQHVVPEYPEYLHIQWTVENLKENDDPIFKVQRSGSPGGDWVTIEEGLTTPAYSDDLSIENDGQDINQLSVDREIYYRIIGEVGSGRQRQVFKSKPVDNEGNTVYEVESESGVGYVVNQRRIAPDPHTDFDDQNRPKKRQHHIHRKKLRDYIVDLREFNGVKMFVLKQKHFGKRCDICWEDTTKTVMKTNCKQCYGTGWEGGYYAPIKTYAKIVESAPQASTQQRGEGERQRARIRLLNFPRVEEKDVLVKIESGDRYVVKNVKDKEVRQKAIKQNVTAEKLGRTSVKYRIPIGEPSIGISPLS